MLELGCGISPLNALALRRRVARYVLTDQVYVQKLLLQNLAEAIDDDEDDDDNVAAKTAAPRPRRPCRRARARKDLVARAPVADVCFRALDWETDAVTAALAAPHRLGFDAVLSCDCVFNEALVAPLVQTCVDACRLRRPRCRRGPARRDAHCQVDGTCRDDDGGGVAPCVCIVAQQLRSDDVFRTWLVAFRAAFHVWRVPPDMLPPDLRPSAGYAIHVGILRGCDDG